MMADFGITNVRIAEFAWALMEPSEGHYDFAWLHKSVDILRAHKLAVILGTPSAAPPPWLSQKYPEVLIVTEQGMTLSPEGRRFTCPSNQLYRRLSNSIAAEMAKSFAQTAGIIGWQIDNEYTLSGYPRCYCKACREGFQEWLRAKYDSLETINKTWGTSFWSQVYTDFSQIPVPTPSGGPPNPGMRAGLRPLPEPRQCRFPRRTVGRSCASSARRAIHHHEQRAPPRGYRQRL